MRNYYFQFAIVLIFTSFFCLYGCGPGRIQVKVNKENDLYGYKTYKVEKLAFAPTLGDQEILGRSEDEILFVLAQELNKRGFRESLGSRPDIIVKAEIGALNTGIVSDEELRFMKGTHGSNFPYANPRLNSLEKDAIHFKMVRGEDGDLLWWASCQLSIEGPNKPGDRSIITLQSAIACAQDLIHKVPKAE